MNKNYFEVDYPDMGGTYKHYKGGLYKVLFMSHHTETDEVLVNYQSLLFGSYHSRPISNWNELISPNPKYPRARVSRFSRHIV